MIKGGSFGGGFAKQNFMSGIYFVNRVPIYRQYSQRVDSHIFQRHHTSPKKVNYLNLRCLSARERIYALTNYELKKKSVIYFLLNFQLIISNIR